MQNLWDVHQFIGHCLIPLDPWCVCIGCQNGGILGKMGPKGEYFGGMGGGWLRTIDTD